MTKEQIIQQIQQFIVENGNNEITATVLRPILEGIVDQTNGLTGSLVNLETNDNTNLVAAINEILQIDRNSGITIITGTTDPTINPPAVYEIGHFYKWLIDGSLAAFYIYNGQEWVLLANPTKATYKNIRKISSADQVKDDDSTIIYRGASAPTITMPPANEYTQRILKIVNCSTLEMTLTITYYTISPAEGKSKVAPQTAIELQSDGQIWNQIQ